MPFIKSECIEKILNDIEITEIISDYVELKKAGSTYKGFSPFTKEKTPSFVVSKSKQIWKDFSSGKGGNAVNFLMLYKNLSFIEALEVIAKKLNIDIEYEDAKSAAKFTARNQQKEYLRPVLEKVQEKYVDIFKNAKETDACKIEVFGKRKYSVDDVIEWGIGFAPKNTIYPMLYSAAKVNEGLQLGIINTKKNDTYTDRVVYPIHDEKGLIIGFAGRYVGELNWQKWINPIVSDTNVLYNKSKVWFGMHKAAHSIRKLNDAIIVEGYNDVISLHKVDYINSIAPCGTSISDTQINHLKKYTDTVTICFDPDEAGQNASVKAIASFISSGFSVYNVVLPNDPDDFARAFFDTPELFSEEFQKLKTNGFKVLIEHYVKGDEIQKSNGAKQLSELIAKVQDESLTEVYSKWLQKESGVRLATIKKWISDCKKEIESKIVQDYFTQYNLPKNVHVPLSEIEDDIKHYGLFMANNQIYVALDEGTDGKINFSSVSNFEIEIINHMRLEGRAKKLVRIKNTIGKEIIFDTDSTNFNSLNKFDDMITDHGNFLFKGSKSDLLKLRTYLFNKMGDGKQIDVLGWQNDGKFWAWNNKVILKDQVIPVDENGVVVVNNTHFYLPSANTIYINDTTKYPTQKKFVHIDHDQDFTLLLTQIRKVHRLHSVSAILYGMSCLFRDHIVQCLGRFPILFLYGVGGSGKDELIETAMSFFGLPQTSISLEANASTIKGVIRTTAQFRNGIALLSEYKRGNGQHDGMLKGFYDVIGYSRGNTDSHISTDHIPIEMGVILTGNDYPDAEPLIQRLIWNEMNKNIFSQEEMNEFDKLKDMLKKPLSGHITELLKKRQVIIDNFEKTFRVWKSILKKRFPEAKERMVANHAILAAIYQILRDNQIVVFPFSQDEMLSHFQEGINHQLRKINSSSVLSRFWDCFISCLRGSVENRIQVHRIVNVEGNHLYIQWTHSFAAIQKQWWALYREAPAAKATILEQIESTPGLLIEKVSSYSFDKGRAAIRSSALKLDLNALSEELRNDVLMSISFQLNQGTIFDEQDHINSNDNAGQEEILF